LLADKDHFVAFGHTAEQLTGACLIDLGCCDGPGLYDFSTFSTLQQCHPCTAKSNKATGKAQIYLLRSRGNGRWQ